MPVRFKTCRRTHRPRRTPPPTVRTLTPPARLTSVIEDLKQRMDSFHGEAEISQGVVIPILQELGWPVFDVHVVTPQFKIETRKADYALCHQPRKPSVLLEVKDLGKADGKGEKQLFEYCFHQGVPMAVLTDGRSWSFFYPAGQGSYHERRFARIDLVSDEPQDSAKTLFDYLAVRAVQSGEARERAQRDYDAYRRQNEAASKYASVWRKLLSGPESQLLDLFRKEVKQLADVTPDRTRAAEFIRAQASIAAKLPSGTKATRGAEKKPAMNVGMPRDMSSRQRLRYRFFDGLLRHAKSRTQRHANISPKKQHYAAAGAGIAGVYFVYAAGQHDARTELYINTKDRERNQRLFSALLLQKEAIEDAFGSPLDWQPLEGRRACRIKKTFTTGGYRDENVWEAIHDELAVAMARLESALKPYLKGL